MINWLRKIIFLTKFPSVQCENIKHRIGNSKAHHPVAQMLRQSRRHIREIRKWARNRLRRDSKLTILDRQLKRKISKISSFFVILKIVIVKLKLIGIFSNAGSSSYSQPGYSGGYSGAQAWEQISSSKKYSNFVLFSNAGSMTYNQNPGYLNVGPSGSGSSSGSYASASASSYSMTGKIQSFSKA